jgi:manganese-dependent inorganic pyrophosphatase
MHNVYVIGHKQPDTDSICSAIGYAELLNRSEPNRYVAARCGDLNAETQFVLSTFQAEPPLYIESVEPNVSDMPFLDPRSARSDLPTVDVAAMMEAYDMRNLPITDDAGTLLGLVSEYGLARAYVRPQKIEPLSMAPIQLETLSRVLNAQTVVSSREILEGRVYIAIDALHVTLSRLTANDVAIVGDNEPAQLALISAGIAALIVADGAPVGERVITAARSRGVSVLVTTLDAFGVGKMINLSLPAGMIMETDIPTVRMDDSLEYAKHMVSNSKFRTACVVDKERKFIGILSRTTLMQEVHKSVILLDHNEPGQAVDGIENADILEIIDHHRLGVISTLKPIRFLNDPVGSTSTIITHLYMDTGVAPSPSTAGLLLSGILSDTLALKMSTTTEKDRRAVDYLAKYFDGDPLLFGTRMVEKGMNLENVTLEDLLSRDTKRYTLFGKDVVIAQVMVPSYEFDQNRTGEIKRELHRLKAMHGADMYIVLFTNIFENGSDVYAAADDSTLARLEMRSQPLRMKNVMSRKKDFLPEFGQMLRSL